MSATHGGCKTQCQKTTPMPIFILQLLLEHVPLCSMVTLFWDGSDLGSNPGSIFYYQVIAVCILEPSFVKWKWWLSHRQGLCGIDCYLYRVGLPHHRLDWQMVISFCGRAYCHWGYLTSLPTQLLRSRKLYLTVRATRTREMIGFWLNFRKITQISLWRTD